jgi:hypothetical protein
MMSPRGRGDKRKKLLAIAISLIQVDKFADLKEWRILEYIR